MMKVSCLVSFLFLALSNPEVDAFVVVPPGGRKMMVAPTTNTRLMATPPESVYAALLSKLERAGETMKEAVQSRLSIQIGDVSVTTTSSAAKAEPAKVEQVAVVEADKKLETAVADVKQAVVELEEKVDIETESPVKTAVNELETAVADLEQAVTTDEAGSTAEAEKLLTTAESELETAITDVESAVDSEPEPVVATTKPEPEGEAVEATATPEPEGESVASSATTEPELESVVASPSTEPEGESLIVTTSAEPEAPVEAAGGVEAESLLASAESAKPEAGEAVTSETPIAFETDAEGGALVDTVADAVTSGTASILEAGGAVIDSLSSL